jgi:hypothetical protein
VLAVDVGWALQMVHLALAGARYDDGLWGLGLFGMLVLTFAAVGLVLLARAVTVGVRRLVSRRQGG